MTVNGIEENGMDVLKFQGEAGGAGGAVDDQGS